MIDPQEEMMQKIAAENGYGSVPLKPATPAPSVNSLNPYLESLKTDPANLSGQHPMDQGSTEEMMRKIMHDEMKKQTAINSALTPMQGTPQNGGQAAAQGIMGGLKGYAASRLMNK